MHVSKVLWTVCIPEIPVDAIVLNVCWIFVISGVFNEEEAFDPSASKNKCEVPRAKDVGTWRCDNYILFMFCTEIFCS